MSSRVFTRLGLPLFLLLAAACSGDDEKPLQPLGPPPVNPRYRVMTQGNLDINIAANGTQAIEPRDIMRAAGESTPCVSLLFLFTYRVDGGKDEVRFITSQDATASEGTEGGASINGCNTINVKNPNDRPVKGTLRYVVAEGL